MQKDEILSTVVYVLMVAVAIALGFAVIAPVFRGAQEILGMKNTVFVLLGIIVAILLNVILFEVAHIVGAKIGGYKVHKVNILGLEFSKDKDSKKVKVKFPRSFDGLTGETVIIPKNENSNPKAYVFSPLFVFLIEIMILIFCYVFITGSKTTKEFLPIKYIQVIIVSVGGMLFIYDYFPAKIDTLTDGYRIVLISKKINIKAYNTLLKINSEIEDEPLKTFDEITDFTALVNLEIAKKLRAENYEKSLDILDKILTNKNNISTETFNKTNTLKLYFLLQNKNKDEAKKVYVNLKTKSQTYIKETYTIDTIKTALLYFGQVELDEVLCNHQIDKIKKALNVFSNKRAEEEIAEIQLIIKEINESQDKFKLIY